MKTSKGYYAIAALWTGYALLNSGTAALNHESMKESEITLTDYRTGEQVVESTPISDEHERDRNTALGLVAINLAIAGLSVKAGLDIDRNQRSIPTVKNVDKPVM